MANQEHLDILKQGVDVWNRWRKEHPHVRTDLSGADLQGADLKGANLRGTELQRAWLSKADLSRSNLEGASFTEADLSEANLDGAIFSAANLEGANLWGVGASISKLHFSDANLTRVNLSRANLRGANLFRANLREAIFLGTHLMRANLQGADLKGANLRGTELWGANLNNADLSEADLRKADLNRADLIDANLSKANLEGAELNGAFLSRTNLSEANLQGADLKGAHLVGTNLTKAILTNCLIYGISAWDVQLEGATQLNLAITFGNQPTITVDNLKVAQFIYLLLKNSEIREVIDTITSKVVLILGRFTPERKEVLDAIRGQLRERNYLPVLFDFDKPASRDITETLSTLAHLARFVIADITEPKSIPQELSHIIPFLPSVPIAPLLQVSEREYGMYEHFISYAWVQPIYHYRDLEDLLYSMQEHIIEPAEKKVRELAIEKAKRLESH